MLVLTRKMHESIMIGGNIELEILEIRGKVVRLGIKAPREVSVLRLELCEQVVTDQLERVNAARVHYGVSPSITSATVSGGTP